MFIRAAFATDDGQKFTSRHFGDANFFDIYEISKGGSKFVKQIKNSTEEDLDNDIHADPNKAKGIAKILLKEKVNIAASKIFGPNIKRIRKKFVCLLFDDIRLEAAIRIIQENYKTIEAEWSVGEDRMHINLKRSNNEKI